MRTQKVMKKHRSLDRAMALPTSNIPNTVLPANNTVIPAPCLSSPRLVCHPRALFVIPAQAGTHR